MLLDAAGALWANRRALAIVVWQVASDVAVISEATREARRFEEDANRMQAEIDELSGPTVMLRGGT